MRLYIYICTFITIAGLALPAFAEEAKKPLIAVLEFRTKLAPEEKADCDPTYFSDVVRSQALDELPDSRIMTRENMTVLLEASGKDLSQCEGECDVDTGRNLGADEVINGELLKVGTSFKLDLKLHATADGRLLAGAQASGKTVDELDAAMAATVTKLLAPLRASSINNNNSMSTKPPPVAVATAATAPTPASPALKPAVATSTYRYIRVVDGRIVHKAQFFDLGQRELRSDAQPMLHEVAAALRTPPEKRAMVICRSETADGTAMRNALQRAWTLRHALVELGVPAGEIQPRAADAAGQAQLVTQVANPYICEIVLR